MKVLFLGTFFPKNNLEDIKKNSKKSIQYASNILQWDYIEGFEKIYGGNLSLLTKMCIGTFPINYKKAAIHSTFFSYKNNVEGISAGFPNIYFVKQLLYPSACYKHIKKWINDNKEDEKLIVAYSAINAEQLIRIKKKYHNIKVALIIPDLPCYMNIGNNNIVYKIKRKYETLKLKKCLKIIDAIIPITSFMERLLNPNNELKSIVIEGMINSNIVPIEKKPSEIFEFCYSGTLTKKYGIMELIEAFKKIKNQNIRLVVCGGGEMAEEVIKSSKEDKRIVYEGIVSSEKAYSIQCQADVLINPRKNDDEFTKYSFPSKLLQYMKTGRPVFCYKLDGIPQEYDKYLIYIKNDKPLKEQLEELITYNKEKLDVIGKTAQEFVFNEKNNITQTKKIVELLGD